MARDASANTAVNILTASTINASTVGSVSTTYYGTLSGTATNANNILYNYDGSHATNFVTATDQNVVNSVIARDSSGNFAANIMTGTATKAKYADLAEKYLADIAYEPGTVLVFGGEEEVTTTTEYADTRVAGVVSTDPAYLMNSESSGVAVALRGKVPVKVSGMIKKGDLLVTSTISGYAEAAQHSGVTASAVFAKSLENKSDSGLGVIMAVVV